MKQTKIETKFIIEGGFNVDANLEPKHDAMGNVIGFLLPDGRTVRLVAALEVESADESQLTYLTVEREMDKLGFSELDYAYLEFYPEKT